MDRLLSSPPERPRAPLRGSMRQTESHTENFRGVWIPAEILSHAQAGRINHTELFLLVTIDSLVGKSEPCYASNAYLAQRMGCKTRAVQYMLKNLRALGLVIDGVSAAGEFRGLETAWSRVAQPMQNFAPPPMQNFAPRITKKEAIHCPNAGGEDNPTTTTPGTTMLLPNLAPTTPGNVQPIDTANAQTLIDAVKRAKGIRTPFRASTWAIEFKRLRDTDGFDDDTIRQVLTWYVAHIGGPFVPEANSATAFRKKFLSIMSAIKRAGAAVVEMTPEGEAILNEIKTLGWRGADSGLPRLVMESLNNVNAFLAMLKKTAPTIGGRHAGLSRKIAESIGPVRAYVLKYLRDVARRVTGWKEFSGRLDVFTWSLTNRDVLAELGRITTRQLGRDVSTEWLAAVRGADGAN